MMLLIAMACFLLSLLLASACRGLDEERHGRYGSGRRVGSDVPAGQTKHNREATSLVDADLFSSWESNSQQAPSLLLLPDHPLPLGHSLLSSKTFLLNYTNFNHGSFGACPRPVLQHQLQLRLQQEQQPDPFLRQSYKVKWNATRVRVADMWQTDYTNLAVLESASTAVNGILRSLEWHEHDVLLLFSTSYGMVKNTAEWLHRHYQIEVVQVPIVFPIDDTMGNNAYLTPLEATLRQLQDENRFDDLKVAVLDHVVSIPAVKLPVVEMATLIRNYCDNDSSSSSSSSSSNNNNNNNNNNHDGVFVLVDGAHAMGQVPRQEIADMLNAKRHNNSSVHRHLLDAYLSNGHKWMYAPKGSAVLWVNPARITSTFPEPTVISSENSFSHRETDSATMHHNKNPQNEDPLYHRFVYTSTKDYTSMVSLSAALDFYDNTLGGEAVIYNYTRSLALQAKDHLIEKWKTRSMAPDAMEVFMFHVVLPLDHNGGDDVVAKATALQHWLYHESDMYVVIVREPTSGYFYTRLSSQVYLEMSDFVRLGDAVLEFLSTNTTAERETISLV